MNSPAKSSGCVKANKAKMIIFFWDASALAKRYTPEIGRNTVNALFKSVPAAQNVSASISYAEIYSILLRKFNRRAIKRAAFDKAWSSLQTETIRDADFVLLPVNDDAIYSGLALMRAYNINSTDATLLTLFLAYKQTFSPESGAVFVLVAADDRLVRAAEAEGLIAVDPETLAEADVPAFLASL